jgi:hypothetical protein
LAMRLSPRRRTPGNTSGEAVTQESLVRSQASAKRSPRNQPPSGHALKVRLSLNINPTHVQLIECYRYRFRKKPKFLFECHCSVCSFGCSM